MEYGLRIATLESAFKSPGDFLDTEFCDSALWNLCPDAPVTALYFGSEFCQDLLPGSSDAEAFCAHCAEHNLEAVLLTPIVTHRGLARIDQCPRRYHIPFDGHRVPQPGRPSPPCSLAT